MSTQYGLNGYVIPGTTQTQGIWLLKDTEYAPSLAPRRTVVEIPAVHYQIAKWDDPMSAINLGLRVRVQGTDPDDLREQWNVLTGLLGMGTNQPIDVTRHRGDHVEYAEAQLISTTSPDFFCDSNRADVQIILNIPGGAWRGDYVEQNFSINATSASTVGLASTMPIVDPLIRVPGPVGSLDVLDVVSGTAINWTKGTTTVPVGNYLLIDPSLMVAHIITSPVWTFTGTNVSGRLTFSGLGPLTITSRRTGPSATATSSLTVTTTETGGPVRIRARAAVV